MSRISPHKQNNMAMDTTQISRRDFCRIGMTSMAALGLTGLTGGGCTKKPAVLNLTDTPPNFIVFLVDMLRADHLGVYGYPKRSSPHIDQLARQGIVFDNAYAPCPWTLPSVVSLLSGLVPPSHRALFENDHVILPSPDAWLPPLFKQRGYTTVCFHTHPYLRRESTNLHLGFDQYHDPSRQKRDLNGFSQHMFMDTLYPACEHWLERNHRKRFFMYIHVIDVHGPYGKIRVLDEDRQQFDDLLKSGWRVPRLPNRLFMSSSRHAYPQKSFLYDGHLFSVDRYVGKLFEKLNTLGIRDNTVMAVTSDHGEGFGEHNGWRHGQNVFDEQVRIPLILLAHEQIRRRAGRRRGLVNTTGLLPTLLDMIGISAADRSDVPSFLRLISADSDDHRYPSLSDWCLKNRTPDNPDAFMLNKRFKLITHKSTGVHFLYDLKTDPGELHPITLSSKAHPRLKDILRKLIHQRKAYLKSLHHHSGTVRKLKADEMRDLETLGYL